MSAGGWSFIIEQGSEFYREVAYRTTTGAPVDLTGYGAEMQIRETVDAPTVIVSLSTQNGRIEILAPATNGKMILRLDTAETTALDFTNAVYDLELILPNQQRKRLLEGSVTLSREVTR